MNYLEPKKLILIGASTGGPSHIQKILSSAPEKFCASIVIAQHMGSEYLPSFASRMNDECKLKVSLVRDALECKNGEVYICDQQTELTKNGSKYLFRVTKGDEDRYNPHIDYLFLSIKEYAKHLETLAIILTGIGEDGAKGISILCERGASCIAESEASSIVYGMPMRAKEMTDTIRVLHIDEIIKEVAEFGRC